MITKEQSNSSQGSVFGEDLKSTVLYSIFSVDEQCCVRIKNRALINK